MANEEVKTEILRRNIPFSPPDMSELEVNEVADCLRSGWITTGPRTKKLEKELKGYLGVDGGLVCLNSATASEELSLRILGIGPGDEVLVPAYTYTSSAAAAIHVGATVKFVDCQGYVNGNGVLEMDYQAMADAITEKTKAIVPVDLGGVPCDYDKIFKIVKEKRNLFHASEKDGNDLEKLGSKIQKAIGRVIVVADGAHALGASRDLNGEKKMVGSIADFTSFSFHAVKNFTTGEGGAAAWKHIDGIDDDEIYHWFQLLSLHGQSKDALAKTQLGAWEYDIVAPLYKLDLSSLKDIRDYWQDVKKLSQNMMQCVMNWGLIISSISRISILHLAICILQELLAARISREEKSLPRWLSRALLQMFIISRFR